MTRGASADNLGRRGWLRLGLLTAALASVAAGPLAAQVAGAAVEPARFHHIHLNVTDVERSRAPRLVERLQAAGVEILAPITYRPELEMRSFFVMGPDKVAVEVVEAKPIPEGVWD